MKLPLKYPTIKTMKSKKNYYKYAVGLILAGVLMAIILVRYTFRSAEVSVASLEANFRLSAEALVAEFENDESKANETYVNKVIAVCGVIAKLDTMGHSLNVTLRQPDDVSGVICGFSDPKISPKQFRMGDTICIKGSCNGYLLDVVLIQCALEP